MSVDACGCCDPGQPATPRTVWNRPGLPEVAYRMGTYGDFREAMLQRVAREPALRPWTARTDDDYGMAVLDLWSYVADILTFYQERTANEAFLRTARMPGSVRRLAALLGYVPAPGLAAEARLAFILDAGKRLTLRERMRVQSLPGDEPGAKPQKFETDAGLEATGELSSVPLRPPALSAATYADVAALTPAVNAPPPPPVGTELVFYASGSGVIERKRVNLVRQRAGLTEIRWEPPRG
ncbi:MAG: hypothetical protein QOF37_2379, partial [Thermoleophilaceae bacterium]|nr:hypothetical protein [Thermoleophilaceae bacterium]